GTSEIGTDGASLAVKLVTLLASLAEEQPAVAEVGIFQVGGREQRLVACDLLLLLCAGLAHLAPDLAETFAHLPVIERIELPGDIGGNVNPRNDFLFHGPQ